MLAVFFAFVGGVLFVWSRVLAADIETRHPPVGKFVGEVGERMHFVDVPAPGSSKPPVLFVHGASGNLLDQRNAYLEGMRGEARLIFVDRPGHGYSERGPEANNSPAGQAERFLQLLDELNIEQVVLVGHSLGSASIAAFAVQYPERVKGLVFVAPATHPWPGGVTWYYEVASLPVIGHLFTETIVLPVGRLSLDAGVESVFSPNPVPPGYARDSGAELVMRPAIFRNNARDVAGLLDHVKAFSPRYKEIKKPTVVITGDQDDIVLASIHSVGLENDIEGAELIVQPGVGHKPDYVSTATAIRAIKKVSR